ncbi:hypothetical protein HHI36_015469 [Cryptolaemus montrouzieri]|uniref:Uncharacterized protein n=1 Tax=Cryptolaemus montrouzieri TaxID=559131 RepID=A0ABD2N5N5_9CUCU
MPLTGADGVNERSSKTHAGDNYCNRKVIDFVEYFKCKQVFHPSCLIKEDGMKSSTCQHEVKSANSRNQENTSLMDIEVENKFLKMQVENGELYTIISLKLCRSQLSKKSTASIICPVLDAVQTSSFHSTFLVRGHLSDPPRQLPFSRDLEKIQSQWQKKHIVIEGVIISDGSDCWIIWPTGRSFSITKDDLMKLAFEDDEDPMQTEDLGQDSDIASENELEENVDDTATEKECRDDSDN